MDTNSHPKYISPATDFGFKIIFKPIKHADHENSIAIH